MKISFLDIYWFFLIIVAIILLFFSYMNDTERDRWVYKQKQECGAMNANLHIDGNVVKCYRTPFMRMPKKNAAKTNHLSTTCKRRTLSWRIILTIPWRILKNSTKQCSTWGVNTLFCKGLTMSCKGSKLRVNSNWDWSAMKRRNCKWLMKGWELSRR